MIFFSVVKSHSTLYCTPAPEELMYRHMHGCYFFFLGGEEMADCRSHLFLYTKLVCYSFDPQVCPFNWFMAPPVSSHLGPREVLSQSPIFWWNDNNNVFFCVPFLFQSTRPVTWNKISKKTKQNLYTFDRPLVLSLFPPSLPLSPLPLSPSPPSPLTHNY